MAVPYSFGNINTTNMTGNSGTRGNKTGSPFAGGHKSPSGYRSGYLGQYTPEQMELFQQMFGDVGPESFLGRLAGGDQALFADIERPALQQFAGLQGNIASKYSGMGLGGRRSSGFQNEQTSAAQQFAQQLQSQRMGLQQQAIRDLSGMRHKLLAERPYEQFMVEKPMPFWQSATLAGITAAGEIGKGWAGA